MDKYLNLFVSAPAGTCFSQSRGSAGKPSGKPYRRTSDQRLNVIEWTISYTIYEVPTGEDCKMAHSGISAGAKGRLVAVIGDEVRNKWSSFSYKYDTIYNNYFFLLKDTCTGFLLGGIGEINAKRQKNFLVVTKGTRLYRFINRLFERMSSFKTSIKQETNTRIYHFPRDSHRRILQGKVPCFSCSLEGNDQIIAVINIF